ncbi:TetR/AcrR family transcriptional regulator [Poseidonocella sp. HB161398]|uniref:TetR/AcrR family transcriptional regulator n=1 Tax=Poseidonocella sp. HB161398 TaxID=2320855 RepID=UPI001486C8D3|nr:TetR/AcrR family transcriptional regulator C-terminal domain-containing protein [Poseidonocella sp. HB161398]
MTGTPPRKRSQGRAAAIGLTKAQVLKAAIDLVDELGAEAFSIRELSRRLDVYPTAIYWHLGGSKADLFSEMTATITSDLMRPGEFCADWRDTLRELFRRYRRAAQRHPHLANLIGAQVSANGPRHAGLAEIVLAALRQAGYDGQPLADAMSALVGGIFGFVTMELAPQAPGARPDWAESFSAALDDLPEAEFPETRRAMPLLRNRAFVLRWSSGAEVPLDSAFEMLVDSLIAGLELRRAGAMAAWEAAGAAPGRRG